MGESTSVEDLVRNLYISHGHGIDLLERKTRAGKRAPSSLFLRHAGL